MKYFLPISCVLLLGVCTWQLLVPRSAAEGIQFAIGLLSLAVMLVIGASLFRSKGLPTRAELPGAWGGVKTPLMRK
jgi:NADH-quinone oxidoreductase subunit H